MNNQIRGKYVRAQVCGNTGNGNQVMRTDAQGRPVLRLDATQTISGSSLDIRSLTAADSAAVTAGNFSIRSLEGERDSLKILQNTFIAATASATLLLGGTTVLTVDISPYSSATFLVSADLISLATTVFLQLAPINSANYFQTVSSQSGLILGGRYLFVPAAAMRYARIYATRGSARY